MRAWCIAFAATLCVELPVYGLALRRSQGGLAALLVGLGVNVVTHPLAWLIASRQGSWSAFFVIELAVWLGEGLLVLVVARQRGRSLTASHALLVALVANALSAGVGLLVLPWLLGRA